MNKERNSIEFKVSGHYALFSDPITRVGGEKFTYQVPTYQALVGIAESIYWKPTFLWVIDALRVMKKIQTESKGVKPLKMNGGNDLSYYTYLRDVEYQVLAHFEWNFKRPELEADRDENKHHNIARRCVIRGGRRDIFLGTRECQGYAEPCTFGEGAGSYDDYGELHFGVMFHSFDYPDHTGNNEFAKRLWRRARMKDGVIDFRESWKELETQVVRPMEAKRFEVGRNFSLLDNDSSVADLLTEEEQV
jgi:CRISPR-associated protein Cas5d